MGGAQQQLNDGTGTFRTTHMHTYKYKSMRTHKYDIPVGVSLSLSLSSCKESAAKMTNAHTPLSKPSCLKVIPAWPPRPNISSRTRCHNIKKQFVRAFHHDHSAQTSQWPSPPVAASSSGSHSGVLGATRQNLPLPSMYR